MHVVIDQNIPGLAQLLAPVVSVTALPGRDITRSDLLEADALVCRSQTFVTEALLRDTPVRFVATATSGTDHIDRRWLSGASIPFADAHGSNAASVVDYVVAAMALHGLESRRDLRELRAGVVGAGAVGSLLIERLRATGISTLVSDPPLAEGASLKDQPIEVLGGVDLLSLHVPLVREGRHPTAGLIDASFLRAMPRGALLVNAARGGVVDEDAWVTHLQGQGGHDAVVDTWDGEPALNGALLRHSRIATPHIAGHSLDAKVDGTRMVARALASTFDLNLDLNALDGMTLPAAPAPLKVALESVEDVYITILALYDLRDDDRGLRNALALGEALPGAFDRLRGTYPVRRDLGRLAVQATGSGELIAFLRGLGVPTVD